MNRKCDAAVEQATALLIQSMQQSDSPIADLGEALARMAQTVNDVATPQARESLVRDLAVCIQSLQFHDRLMQQLTHARDLLTGNAATGLFARIPNILPNVSANEGSIEGTVELF